MAMAEPRCSIRNCKHLIGVKQDPDENEESERVVCAAFPEGIPSVIAYGDELHLKPFPGDHGIQYEKKDD